MTNAAGVSSSKKYTAAVQYIIGYNLLCFIGCLIFFYLCLVVVHAAVGLVRSPVFTTAQQVASRIFIVWGILVATPEAIQLGSVTPIKCDFVFDALTSIDDHVGLPMPVFVKSTAHFAANHIYQYSITEVIRYSFYAFKEVGSSPALLTWLRYTTFILLYPIGVSSELAMVWLALPVLRSTKLWCLDMPNQFNMVFDYHIFCIMAMLAYAPGFPPLYMYMFKQRKKVLAPVKAKEK